MSEIIKFLPIGGQSEMGKNMYVISINNHIFIIDAGYRIPESDKIGVDIIIPSFDYLIENQDRIEGIFITHAHNDSMAALPYLLRDINIPIYTSDVTADLIEVMIEKYNKLAREKIIPSIKRVHRKSTITVAGVEIKIFALTHSIPGNIGLAFKTKYGYIVHLGEFMVDYGAPSYFKTDMSSMMEISSQGVLALLCESSYAKRIGYTSPNHKIYDILKPIFEESSHRIIISAYSQNVFRIKEIVDLVRNHQRKVIFLGDTTEALVKYNVEDIKPVIDYEGILLDSSHIGDAHHDNQVIILVENPTKMYQTIDDLVQGNNEYLKIESDDTFIIVSESIPGTEKISAKTIDELYRTDAKIYTLKNYNVTSMHASTEDIKVALQMFEPKYFFPVRGEYQHFIACEDIAIEMGIDPSRSIIADNGEIVTIIDGELDPHRTLIEIEDVMIDGIGIGDVGEKVIDDRIQLSNDGVVIIGITVNKKREIITFTDVQTRGFVYLKDSEHIVKGITSIAEDTIVEYQYQFDVDLNELRSIIKDRVTRFILKSNGKKPVILPVIIELQS